MLNRLLSGDYPRSKVLAAILLAVLLGLALAPFLFPGVKALNVAAKVLVFVVLQALLAWKGHGLSVVRIEAAQAAARLESAFTQWKFRHAEVVAGLGMTPALQARWQQRHAAYMGRQGEAQALSHRIAAISKWVRYSQQSLSLGAGALLVIDGQLSPGAMIAANVLMTRALAPIDLLVNTWRAFLGARTAFERLTDHVDRRQLASAQHRAAGHDQSRCGAFVRCAHKAHLQAATRHLGLGVAGAQVQTPQHGLRHGIGGFGVADLGGLDPSLGTGQLHLDSLGGHGLGLEARRHVHLGAHGLWGINRHDGGAWHGQHTGPKPRG